MSMKNQERLHIEYHPRLGLNINVGAIIEEERQSTGEAYHLPEEIMESLENPPCRSLEKALGTIGKIDNLLDGIEGRLTDTVSDGIPFQEYLDNKGPDGDLHIVHQWEDHQNLDLNGSIEGEVYPILLEVRENLVDKVNLLNKEVLVGDIEYDKIDDICKHEKQKIEDILRNDIAKSDPDVLASLKMNNELTDAISGAVDGIADFVDDVTELLDMNVDEIFEGIDEVVSHLTDASPENLDRLSMLASLGFAAKADAAQDIRQRMDRVKESSAILHEEISTLRKMKADAGKVMQWFEGIDTDYDSSPITHLIEDNLESVDTILDSYDDVLLDIHKGNEMQAMQFEDLTDNLYAKETYRQTTKLTANIKKHFDRSDRQKDKQVKRFTQNMGYKKKKVRKTKSSSKVSLMRSARK